MKAKLASTKDLPYPNIYAQMLLGEFSHRAFDQEQASTFKGKWGESFEGLKGKPIDVEIGTGNGYHFAHRASTQKERGLIGLEVKYKPLIQSIRRAITAGAKGNAYIARYNARDIKNLFDLEEINNVFIHHPDPWLKKKQWKHRLIQAEFLDELHGLMQSGSFVEFKTDSEDYFDWSEPLFNDSKFKVEFSTRDLHNSSHEAHNFVTHFEQIFLRKGQPIFYLKAFKI